MKTLLRSSIFLLLMTVVVSAGFSEAEAQPRLRLKSRQVLNRTNVALKHAQMVAARNQVYTGDLAKAVRHQRLARRLHRNGMFVRSINHSRRARALAFASIRANREQVPANMEFTNGEAGESSPNDAALDQAAEAEEPNAPTQDQQVLQEGQPDVQQARIYSRLLNCDHYS